MKTVTGEEIRKAFPNPVQCSNENYEDWKDGMKDSYCVGGAFFLYTNPVASSFEQCKFPGSAIFGIALKVQNYNLTNESALALATKIIRANDEGNFEEAWKILGDALDPKKFWSK